MDMFFVRYKAKIIQNVTWHKAACAIGETVTSILVLLKEKISLWFIVRERKKTYQRKN